MNDAMGGGGWTFAVRGQEPVGGVDRIAVFSRWPVVEIENDIQFRNGGGIVVRVEHPTRALRLLLVDGMSDPLVLRTPMLDDIARFCRESEAAGVRIDIIAGDFNSISRSVGFDAFVEETSGGGYRLASESSSDWKGTYHATVPLFDIDHVWLRRSLTDDLECNLFTSTKSNHRGQVVRFNLAEPHDAALPVGSNP
jgi:hypothetical protein